MPSWTQENIGGHYCVWKKIALSSNWITCDRCRFQFSKDIAVVHWIHIDTFWYVKNIPWESLKMMTINLSATFLTFSTWFTLSASAHLAFLQSCNKVAFLQEDDDICTYLNAWVHSLRFYSTIKKRIISYCTLLLHVAVKSDVGYNK